MLAKQIANAVIQLGSSQFRTIVTYVSNHKSKHLIL